MILPITYLAALLLSIASMICLGSWGNLQKLAGKWRFELFYYDYSLGALLAALIAAFTFGTLHSHDLTFSDNLLIVSKHQMAYALAAGAIFNLGNLLMIAAASIAGLSVAFPISLGVAIIIGVVWTYFSNAQGDPVLLFGGALLVLIAIGVNAYALSAHLSAKQAAALKALTPDPRVKTKAPKRGPGAARGVLVAVFGGILLSLHVPLVEVARLGDDGVSPYGLAVLFTVGMILTTLVYVPFFMNFPVEGVPLQITAYFKGKLTDHIWGVLGGMLWLTGALCGFLAYTTPSREQLSSPVATGIAQGAPVLAALWGLIAWREFKGSNERVRLLLIIMLVVLVSGLAMIAMAPLRAK